MNHNTDAGFMVAQPVPHPVTHIILGAAGTGAPYLPARQSRAPRAEGDLPGFYITEYSPPVLQKSEKGREDEETHPVKRS